MDIRPFLERLLAAGSLSESESEAVFEALLTGQLDAAQIGGLLALLQSRGVTVDELTGAARVMRRHVTPIQVSGGLPPIVDTCGTGGAPKAFNVSTAAAIVAAAAGRGRLVVAKHGNRSRTGRGSAEILARLGVNVDASPEVQARCLEEAGVCFCFAIHHHPAMRHAAGPRKSLGFPTIFNLLGPLTNPAGADRQLIGVYRRDLVELVGQTLARLGARRAMVVHGLDGMDELSVCGESAVARIEAGRFESGSFDPAAVGIGRAEAAALRVETLDEAAAAIEGVLSGEAGARREIVALNAAAALVIGEAAADLETGLAMSREAIDTGEARQTLERLARVSAGA